MNPVIACAIQHHPSREHLLARVWPTGMQPEFGKVVVDPGPVTPPSAWRTYRACLEWGVTQPSTHLLILQDDAAPIHNLLLELTAAIRAHPEAVIVACVTASASGNCRRMTEAAILGFSWAVLDPYEWCPAVATCWPTWVAGRLLAWSETHVSKDAMGDDAPLGMFLQQAPDISALITIPSLVDHPDVAPSIVAPRPAVQHHPDPSRQAFMPPPTMLAAPGIDWSRGP